SDQQITQEIYDAGFKNTSINLKKGDEVSVWTDLDISYEGDLRMDYIVLILNGNDTVYSVQALPFDVNVKMKSVETSLGNKHNMSYEGKMATFPPLPDDGEYVFSSVLRSSVNETIELRKADLVIRK
ncbi:MAG: hypothetical protein MRY83_21440, partial [Flavobacteriales bacterium]|nr:hypothetical protein [Flavobacteriales bacterium]